MPKSLGTCIEPVTRPVFKSRGIANVKLITEWRSIAGQSLADYCIPEKLSYAPGKTTDGTLTISVASGFATELQHMQPVILERINIYFGYKAVSRISISHSFVPSPPPVPPSKPIPTLPPLAAASADMVSDPELKEALKSLADTLAGKKHEL